MVTRGTSRGAVALPAADRTALEALAADPSAGASSLRARIVLACAASSTDAAVAAELDVDARTVGKWRRRYAQLGVAGLAAQPSEPRDPGGPALLTPLTEPPAGRAWTTRSVAVATGLSQSMVSRVWRAAGFRPPPPDVLVADPLFRGRVRLLAGVHVAAARPSTTAESDQAVSEPCCPRHVAAAFWVDDSPSTPRSRAREDQACAVTPAEARHTAWDAATSLCHATDELTRILAEPAGPCCGGEFIEFLSVLARRCPAGAALWVLLNHQPGPTLARWARGHRGGIQLRHTPSAASWTAVVARSLAATTLVVANRELPSSVETATAHLRHHGYGTPGSSAAWLNGAADIQLVFDQLRRPARRPRPPRPQLDVPDVGEAIAGLRRRRPPGFVTDLPVFEQLVHIRRRAAGAALVWQDCMDAMVVLADLHTTRDLAEHALMPPLIPK